MTQLTISVIRKSEKITLPEYATPESAGVDIRSYLEEALVLRPGMRILVPTGISLDIPKGFEVQVRPRSGLALKHGITVLNTPGTIDSDYQGEIKVILINLGEEDFIIEPDMRIAQLVVAPILQVKYCESTRFSRDTDRGQGGFGHTGHQ